MLHESGTGGVPKYGVVSQMPTLGNVVNPLVGISLGRMAPDVAIVTYYKSSLNGGITVELAGTPHAGLFQYSFPTQEQPNIIIDVSHFLSSFRGDGWSQTFVNGSISILEDGHYEGCGTYANGWNLGRLCFEYNCISLSYGLLTFLAPPWTICFCGRFEQSSTSYRSFVASNITLTYYDNSTSASGNDRVVAIFSWNSSTTSVISRVGVSFLSSGKACQYLDDEIPSGAPLDILVNNSVSIWDDEVFSKITTTETNKTLLGQPYTNLYGLHLLPSNRTGDNLIWTSIEPNFDDVVTFWDLHRCTTPLWHILQSRRYTELLRSLTDTWRHEGFLPDARSSNFNGRTQGGSSADNILADAFVKGVNAPGFSWDDAYRAMWTDANVNPPPNFDTSAPDSSTKQGRGALPDWIERGYITTRFTRAVTRAVEYSGNDFALYQVALKQDRKHATCYLERSRNWCNHWNPASTSLNVSGFLVPCHIDGGFVEQDPMSCNRCSWPDPYYEGKPWEYTVNAVHDVAQLIELGGGATNFINRLNIVLDPQRKIFYPGNEVSFMTPYLYHWAGRQDPSVVQSRFVAKHSYAEGKSGLPGASDAGAMQSWLLWNMIGLYPVTGQTTFLIGFPDLTLDLRQGKSLKITQSGGNSDAEYYVQSLTVNGQPWNKNWLTYEHIFADGGNLDFALGAEPSKWSHEGELPPSPASYNHGSDDTREVTPISLPDGLIGKRFRSNSSNSSKIIIAAIAGSLALLLILSVLSVWLQKRQKFFDWFKTFFARCSFARGVVRKRWKRAVDTNSNDMGKRRPNRGKR